MNLFRNWSSYQLHGAQLLEAHEDWLIQTVDTLGHGLQRADGHELIADCLEQLLHGMQQFISEEFEALAEIGHVISQEQHEAHAELMLRLSELSCRHQRGEAVGSELLTHLQHWLQTHCTAVSGHPLQ